MQTLAEAAFRNWATWLGQSPQALKKSLGKRLSNQRLSFEKMGRTLMAPPSENTQQGVFHHASVDQQMWSLAKQWNLKPRTFWPKSEPYAICITHDIDRIFSSFHPLTRIKTEPLKAMSQALKNAGTLWIPAWHEKNPFYNFKRLQSLEREWGVPSACYVLFEKRRFWFAIKRKEPQHFLGVYAPQKIFDPLLQFESNGNEVGIHGSFDSWKSSQALQKECTALKEAGIRQLSGIRNHYLNFNFAKTPNIQSECGFHYDSTFGFNFISGFRSGTSFPFSLGQMWELPFQLMDSSLRHQHKELAAQKKVALDIVNEVRKWNGVLVLNWHFRIMNPNSNPTEIALLDAIIQQGKKDGAWFARPRDVIQQWNTRIA